MKGCLRGRGCVRFMIVLAFLAQVSGAAAELQTFIKEYTYAAGEMDSLTSCRAIAVERVKRTLLEELGTYVESKSTVQDLRLEKDDIRTLTAGIVRTVVLAEKWDGRTYWLQAELKADPDEVAASLAKLKENEDLAQELTESRQEAEDALAEVERLKTELASAADSDSGAAPVDTAEKQAQYNDAATRLAATDWFEQGTTYAVAGSFASAVVAYNRAISLRPADGKAYVNRSNAYVQMGQYSRAAEDLKRAAVVAPARSDRYFSRIERNKEHRERRISPGPAPRPGTATIAPTPHRDDLQRVLDKHRELRRARPAGQTVRSAPSPGPRTPTVPRFGVGRAVSGSTSPGVSRPPAPPTSRPAGPPIGGTYRAPGTIGGSVSPGVRHSAPSRPTIHVAPRPSYAAPRPSHRPPARVAPSAPARSSGGGSRGKGHR